MSRTIATILSLNDKMSPKLVGVSKKVAGMSKEMQRASAQSVNMANKFGKNMMGMADKIVKTTAKFVALGAVVGAGVVFKVGIEGLKELDAAAAKVKTIAGANLEKKDIKAGLLKTSNQTGINTTELGDTQYNAISSGVDAKDSLVAAVTSAKLAKAGFTDSNSALKILTATMNVYGLKGQKAMQSISDKMLITQNLGVTTVAELAESMGILTPIASSAGLSIDELMSSMVGLTKNGIKTDEAVTSMKGIMTSIISPTKESADMAKKLGINFTVAGMKSKGFVGFMEEIKKKTGGSTEKMAGLFGNVRALSGALVLAGGGLKDTKAAMTGMEKSAGATDTAFAEMENTIGAKMDKLKNRFKNTATSIVDTQSGMMGKIADKMVKWLEDNEANIQKWVDNTGMAIMKVYDYIKKIIDFVIEHKSTIETFLIVFGSFYIAVKSVMALKAAFVALKTIIVLTSGAMAITPFGAAVIAIGLLIAAGVLLWKNWDTVKVKLDNFAFGMKNAFSNVGTFVKNIFKGMANDFIDNINSMIGLLNKLPGVKINAIKKYDMGEYASLTRPDGNSASRSYEAMAQRQQTITTRNKLRETHLIPQHAMGSSYSSAGLSLIHEKGGEIRKLSSGETIIPADKSKQLLNKAGGGNTFIINFNGNVGDDEFFDRAGNRIVGQIKLALSNM